MDNIAILETWTESESGWGQRPDGCSLHLNKEKYKAYVENHWNDMKTHYGESTPHEYDRPDDNLQVVKVSDELYERISKSEFGIRMWRGDFNKFLNEGQIQKII